MYLPKQSPTDEYVWTPLNTGNPLNQCRRGLDAHMKEPVWSRRVRLRFFQRRVWISEHLKGIPVRQPDTSKGDKLRVDIICRKCRDPRTTFVHVEPRYSMQGTYVRRSFFCDTCNHREFLNPWMPPTSPLPFD